MAEDIAVYLEAPGFVCQLWALHLIWKGQIKPFGRKHVMDAER